MATSVNIGDSQEKAVQPVVSGLILAPVAQADVADVDSAINNKLYSGKQYGACYIMALTAGGTDIIVAQGDQPADAWHRISDAGAAPITPA